ncbi:MAG: hypothetical protein AAFZ74_01975 [Pseudomonadota bacterium]
MSDPVKAIPTDSEFLLQVENQLLKGVLRQVRDLLEIPERPSQTDELYYAHLAGQLKGQIQMALNAIDCPIAVTQETTQ